MFSIKNIINFFVLKVVRNDEEKHCNRFKKLQKNNFNDFSLTNIANFLPCV
jgi:hypothetical protein